MTLPLVRLPLRLRVPYGVRRGLALTPSGPRLSEREPLPFARSSALGAGTLWGAGAAPAQRAVRLGWLRLSSCLLGLWWPCGKASLSRPARGWCTHCEAGAPSRALRCEAFPGGLSRLWCEAVAPSRSLERLGALALAAGLALAAFAVPAWPPGFAIAGRSRGAWRPGLSKAPAAQPAELGAP